MMSILTPAQTGIDVLAADVLVSQDTVTMFKELFVKFPDLIIYRPDPNKATCYPCSKSVNKYTDECQIIDDKPRGEGNDVDIFAWMYTTIGDFRVYSDPPYMVIGRVNTAGFGVVPTENWEDILDKVEMSSKVIRKIRNHLKGRPAIYYT